MSPHHPRPRRFFLPLAALLLAALAASGTGTSDPSQEKLVPSWKEVDRLISEQKYQAARELTGRLREKYRAEGERAQEARTLIREVQLITGLHGYETAVRFLKEEPWPDDPTFRAALELFYAQSLLRYYQAYSWEIDQRERLESEGPVDLKAWTRDQLYQEAHRAFYSLWTQRESWGNESLGELAEMIDQNDYPARIRGTLRDAVSYLWVELLANTGLWSPSHSSGVYRLPLEELVGDDPAAIELDDPELHPLLKITAVLHDLEGWHREYRRPEAAFEARRDRLQRLASSFTQEADQERIRHELTDQLERLGSRYPWWSLGMSTLAEMTRSDPAPDALVRVHEIAEQGLRAHPDTVGGQRCRHTVATLENRELQVMGMTTDGARRRSLLVRHRNLESLYFRAFALDLLGQIETAQDRNVLPGWREVPALLDTRAPDAEWSVQLPPTPDFRTHQTFVTPPLDQPGLYLIVASTRRDFASSHNFRTAVNFVLSDLVLLTRAEPGRVEVTVRSGDSGQVVPGARVHLYRYDWQKGHRRVSSEVTGADGSVRIELRDERNPYFLVAESGEDRSVDLSHLRAFREREEQELSAALIYTDRTVYRPHQTLHWKAVAYAGKATEGRLHTRPEAELHLELVDANGEVVEALDTLTNEFGSVAGEFQIPAGRLLGSWQLRSSSGGRTEIRVEEYKRPTFEVTLLDPEKPMQLNRSATLHGEVRYYFGLPVVTGEVDWRVVREAIYPWWWHRFGRPARPSETIAAGRAELDEDGRFAVTFVPEADERQRELTYRYRLMAEVTDEGGETRSSSRAFRLGFVSVEASVTTESGFFASGEPASFTVRRTDLDGVGRPGAGSWSLRRLEQPESTLLPADQPQPEPEPGVLQTPGDRLRPRWAPEYRPESILRRWPDGEVLNAGECEHDTQGEAEIRLDSLRAGAYRLRYSTRDDEGSTFDTQHEFLVAGKAKTPVRLPAVLLVEQGTVQVGGTARVLVHSGLDDQPLVLELFRKGRPIRRWSLDSKRGLQIVEIPVGTRSRGGFGLTLTALRDHQAMRLTSSIFVPWKDRELQLEFESFRDRLRPGDQESWRLTVKSHDGQTLEHGAAELLAYMYDRSLDLFAPHQPPRAISLFPTLTASRAPRVNLGVGHPAWSHSEDWSELPSYPSLTGDRLVSLDAYGIGGPGSRGMRMRAMSMDRLEVASAPAPAVARVMKEDLVGELRETEEALSDQAPAAEEGDTPLRTDFSETAFWHPHLLTREDGSVSFEFTVPDSVTEWNVWVHALTRDLRSGSVQRQTRSLKELLVRPYVPRFFREGDRATLEVVLNNAGETTLSGQLDFEVFDPESGRSLQAEFGLETTTVPFEIEAGRGTTVGFELSVPARVGTVAFKAVGRAGDHSDGEQRPVPILPGRVHLAQSRFATLKDRDTRELKFAELARSEEDPTLINEQLVVTLDGQLFYGVLGSLPYLVDFPYECTEQTLNRFVSTGIVSSVFERYPSVANMAGELAQRESRYEPWVQDDPNRRMALVETPWLRTSRGGNTPDEGLIRVLDPRVANAQREAALAQLEKAQTSLGAFPWWPGGPPSPYMTLYLLHGFSRALEFEVTVPQEMVVRAWSYLHRHYVDELVRHSLEKDCCWQMVTFLNYVLSSYPDESWSGGLFGADERRRMLDFSFRHWREHAPLLKAQLALTLARSGRPEDARLVFDSVMDSSQTTRDEGTFWAPEDRGWLWYNDRIETHAYALRTLTELDPGDSRRHGLVQWLFLNKKLNHWKSTRSTAEVIYSLVHYLEREGTLGGREAATVEVGTHRQEFVFDPDEYSGRNRQLVLSGDEVGPETATVRVSKETPGLLFASATWHFSTEKLPEEASGDLFRVERRYFRRVHDGRGWTLQPMREGSEIVPGDQLEVQLSIRARHAAEYVHLRDPRGAGFEPESLASGYRWDLGLAWYEEIRDSGTNFFFEWLPAGEYTLKYRLRANMKGSFRVGPATLQSMYAPEFAAYSSGATLAVAAGD